MKFVDLKLPEKKEFVHRITFRADEKKKYDTLLFVRFSFPLCASLTLTSLAQV